VEQGLNRSPGVLILAVLVIATGAAQRGPWLMNDSDYRWVDDPTVAIDGDVGVAWVDQAKKDLFFQRYDAANKARLASPTNVSKSPSTFSWGPRIAMSGRNVSLLWQEIEFTGGTHGGEIHFARSQDGGATFAAPINLSNSTAGDGKGRLSKDLWDNGSLDLVRADQGLYAVWTEYEGALWLRRSTDGGATFERAVRVAKDARGPSIAVHKSAVHVAWSVAGKTIELASSEDGGRSFGTARTLFEGDAPKLAVDSKGNIHLAFAKGNEVHYSADLKSSRRIDHAKLRAGFPTLRIDGKDRVYAVWEEFLAPNEHPRALMFATSTDGFTPRALPIASASLGYNGSQQGLLTSKLDVSASGEIAVVNSTFRANERSDVWLLRATSK
jgi:hypothetical protein